VRFIIVGGLVTGSVYAIAALGLVLTYTSSRVFNFAHGAIAFFVAIFFHNLVIEHGWPRWLAGVFCAFVFSPALGLFLYAVLFKRLADAPPTVRLVSTVGLWVALPALARLLWVRDEILDRTGVGPEPAKSWRFWGITLNSNQLTVLVAAAAVALGLAALLRFTSFGLSVRSTVDSPVMAGMTGTNTALVSAGSWMIGITLAGMSGILLAPLQGYLELNYTLLLLGAFGAVVVAKLHSLLLAFVGSLLLGLAQNLVQWREVTDILTTFLAEDSIILRGLNRSMPFIVMIVFLLAYRGLGRERFAVDTRALAEEPEPEVDETVQTPRWRSTLRVLIPIAVVALAPVVLAGRWEAIIARGLALSIAFLSYTIVAGEGGMISLCQITFAGLGGVFAAELATNEGWPVLVAIPVAALLVAVIGLVVALPSLRLGDLYLALATLAFAELVQNMYFQKESVNNFDQGIPIDRPSLGFVDFDGDTAFYYLLVVVFVVMGLLVLNLQRSTTGLRLAAVRSSEPAAATLGVSIVRAKLVVFSLSAFVAAIGGGFFVSYAGNARPFNFYELIGIVWLALVVTWGVRSVTGALLGGLAYALFPQIFLEYEWTILVILLLILFGMANQSRAGAVTAGLLLVLGVAGLTLTDTVKDTVLDHIGEVPITLFGFGAIMVAREPRGVLYDAKKRRRERRLQRAARRAATDDAAAAAEAELVRA
jgi:branched-chain amino acid transport system permease protein